MGDNLIDALKEFVALGCYIDSNDQNWKVWATKNGLKLETYDETTQTQAFFDSAARVGMDDKYVSGKFLIRSCPSELTVSSPYIKLFSKYGIDEVIVTVEARTCLVVALMLNGYCAESVHVDLTDKWGRNTCWADDNKAKYSNAILLKKQKKDLI